MKGSLKKNPNVCSEKKYTKCSSVLLLRLVYFFSERMLFVTVDSFWMYFKEIVQSNLVISNFLVTLKLFLNAKRSLSLWSK